MKKYTPSTLSHELDALIRSRYPAVLVEGEVGQIYAAASGHRYLELRDRNARLKCICWRDDWNNLRFAPKQGDKVICRGRLGVYGQKGHHQLTVHVITPSGEGDLARKIAETKQRLMADGLLDPTRKRVLPRMPAIVGVATSLSGAALQDFLKVTGERHPSTRILVAGCTVQGAQAPASVLMALELLIEDGRSEVLVITRGGGSKEDLLAFQDEQLARFVARCPIPVVSAVGHQIDTTMCDLVADAVEPTPSAAAARVVPDDSSLRRQIDEESQGLHRAMSTAISVRKERVTALRNRLRHPGERLALVRTRRLALLDRMKLAMLGHLQRRQVRVDGMQLRMLPALRTHVAGARGLLQAASGRLEALSPLAVLGRGYSIVRNEAGLVRSIEDVSSGDPLKIRVADGEIDAVAGTGEPQMRLF